jgi:hypothetical protein
MFERARSLGPRNSFAAREAGCGPLLPTACAGYVCSWRKRTPAFKLASARPIPAPQQPSIRPGLAALADRPAAGPLVRRPRAPSRWRLRRCRYRRRRAPGGSPAACVTRSSRARVPIRRHRACRCQQRGQSAPAVGRRASDQTLRRLPRRRVPSAWPRRLTLGASAFTSFRAFCVVWARDVQRGPRAPGTPPRQGPDADER